MANNDDGPSVGDMIAGAIPLAVLLVHQLLAVVGNLLPKPMSDLDEEILPKAAANVLYGVTEEFYDKLGTLFREDRDGSIT